MRVLFCLFAITVNVATLSAVPTLGPPLAQLGTLISMVSRVGHGNSHCLVMVLGLPIKGMVMTAIVTSTLVLVVLLRNDTDKYVMVNGFGQCKEVRSSKLAQSKVGEE